MRRTRVGAVAVVGIVVVNVVAWALFWPADDGRPNFLRQAVAEFAASTAVLLFAVALVLATRASWIEPFFGGLDRMYRAHRRAAVAGFVLLVAHVTVVPWLLDSPGGTPSGLIAFAGISVLVLLSVGPRLPLARRIVTLNYRSWRHSHWLVGLFFAISLAHALLVDQVVVTSPVPFTLLLAAYVVGVVAYLYTVLLARLVRPRYRYVVDEVRRLNPRTLEISLRPHRARRLAFTSGQFVFLQIRRSGLREPHPFTVSSAPAEERLRLTVKAVGDYTARLHERVETGHRATVEGSYGMLDYRRGGPRQIWIAGGIGITPFLSWLRDLDQLDDRRIDLYYTVRQPAEVLFWDEVREVAARNPGLRIHLNVSAEAGSLTVARLVAEHGAAVAVADVFMCGPVPMIRTFERGLRQHGVPAARIHFEEFSFR
ncbi:FAD-binding oxidoreductase [Micromonospora sp. WMMD1102]|uniref:ferredoxin reductase family protein n=1 Tax=Micromonospora sp. WMMD1102 TaxID=3016105 RepID=UPI0024157B5F|nr:FAD-binding oxidoreductase [Micromonospora sp. WMMD1102]MDG4789365.1 FAD-binding oxidoreductase [Micromonospora sp. WMMD1102]